MVQGWRQVPGVDPGCAYAPVCRIQSIRMALDVQTVFLNAIIEEEVYVKILPGYGSVDVATGLPHVMKLKNSIYGHRQSPRNWFNTTNDSLKDMQTNVSTP